MSINTLREHPIPPQPKGWGLLGQQVELSYTLLSHLFYFGRIILIFDKRITLSTI